LELFQGGKERLEIGNWRESRSKEQVSIKRGKKNDKSQERRVIARREKALLLKKKKICKIHLRGRPRQKKN